ncbi:MAG: threonylcarbamoyl-AMP synthase [Ignavibacteria bacterium GWB2_35_12]|nr:MAG: threonylcarbamoyl-AMP synthase [Ignavibacteria bacterium GWB2_35_12]OGU91971.1 MAG: threonylcarbamoyl-AMP synthase [Ignavibacteria bacterium RIFOXYA2_FULL_35_10]OGV24818.1 MAG: threonylcarbamoyl-AMP synthase [Ignavibacteria bacterium RIFOXYC2_FULL_35_21]
MIFLLITIILFLELKNMLKDNIILGDSNLSEIQEAVRLLNEGEIIGFPTETVYGIGGDIFNEEAVNKIFEIKNRQLNLPLSAHLSSISDIEDVAFDVPDEFFILADKFLPGPLTIILKKKKSIPDSVTSGLKTIGIRVPDNKIIHKLLEEFGKPLAASSANLSGKRPALTSEEVITYFPEGISLILDGGRCRYSQESTVISLVEFPPLLIREGVIRTGILEDILKVRFGK